MIFSAADPSIRVCAEENLPTALKSLIYGPFSNGYSE